MGNDFLVIAGIGMCLFLFFAGAALFYWVVSNCDRKDKKEVKP